MARAPATSPTEPAASPTEPAASPTEPATSPTEPATSPTEPAASPTEGVLRGSIWWVDLNPTRGSEIRKIRPAVVLTADALNRVRRTVVVVPLSTGPAPRPPIVVAVPSAGDGSAAVCDQIRAVDRSRLTRADGALSPEDLRAVESGVRAVLLL